MDDFHNADAHKYGRFDLAFAHGVYYHSFAPFLFFENLISLSDNIFIGGYTTNAKQSVKSSRMSQVTIPGGDWFLRFLAQRKNGSSL